MTLYFVTIAILALTVHVWRIHEKPEQLPALEFTRPLHISHRGGAALAPENSLMAFEQAVFSFHTDMLEIDVHASRDAVLVVHHDEEVGRTTDGRGLIKEKTLDELRKLDAGYSFTNDGGGTFPYRGKGIQIPTLEEVLSRFPDLLFHIDVKQSQPAIEGLVMDLLRRKGMLGQVFLGSTCEKVGRRIRRIAPDLVTFPSRKGLERLYVIYRLKLLGLYPLGNESVAIPPALPDGRPIITGPFVRKLHRRGRKVLAFVVDDPLEQRRLLDLGVDGIMTDRPDVLRETLDAWSTRP